MQPYGEVELSAGANGKLVVSLGLTKRLVVLPGGIGVGRQDASYPIHMASGAYVTAGGTWTDASSRALKTNITVGALYNCRIQFTHSA